MRILILNWRDIKNPLSGGAEVLTHEMAKGYVKQGHHVIWFCSYYPGAKKQEIIDGVHIIRDGQQDLRALHKSVHVRAYHFYKNFMEGRVDVVIDEIHGLPFFTPWYVKEKKVAFICEVAKDIWDKMFPFPWNLIGKFVEKMYFIFYRHMQFLTISPSTKLDLIDYGIPKKRITVMPMGIHRIVVPSVKKEKNKTIIFVGRINKMKGIEDALDAFALVHKEDSKSKFWIVGSGSNDYVSYLKKKIKKMKLSSYVTFWGYVSQEKKFELMANAWAIVVPSIREGFGLIVPEANSVGTPAVVYNVPGLRDIVKNGVNGVISEKNTPQDLAHTLKNMFEDMKKYNRMKQLAKEESKVYNWKDTISISLKVLTTK